MILFTDFQVLTSTVNTMTSENNCLLKRKTLKLSCPNPLFDKWLQEWKDEAASKNAETQHAFAKVIYVLPHSACLCQNVPYLNFYAFPHAYSTSCLSYEVIVCTNFIIITYIPLYIIIVIIYVLTFRL